MRFSLASLSFLLLAAACGQVPAPSTTAPPLMATDFDQCLGWGGGDQSALTTAQAHSGRVATLASPQVPFSYTFARHLEQLSPTKKLHQLELTAWVRRTDAGSLAKLVTQVDVSDTDETHVFYAATPVAEAAPALGEWVAVKVPITLPATAEGTNKLKVYLWNDQATSPTYLDDVALTVVADK